MRDARLASVSGKERSMARVLEPLLWRRLVVSQVLGGTLQSEDIDLDLAANEGFMLMGLDFTIMTEYVSTADFNGVVIARPDAQDVIANIVEAQSDSDFIAGMHHNVAVVTTGGTGGFHERDWRPPGAEGGDGLVLARRMTYLQDTSATLALIALTIWYKRLIFTDNEMLGLLIRRR